MRSCTPRTSTSGCLAGRLSAEPGWCWTARCCCAVLLKGLAWAAACLGGMSCCCGAGLSTGVIGVAAASLGRLGMLLAAVLEPQVRQTPGMHTAADSAPCRSKLLHPSLEQWKVQRLALPAAGMLAGRALSARRWLPRLWQQAPSCQPMGPVQMVLPKQQKHCTCAGAGWQQSPSDVATVRPLSTT